MLGKAATMSNWIRAPLSPRAASRRHASSTYVTWASIDRPGRKPRWRGLSHSASIAPPPQAERVLNQAGRNVCNGKWTGLPWGVGRGSVNVEIAVCFP